ncbi:MAG: hypothetical protein R6X34_23200 [Chloroflexota bacterium]
MAAEEWGENGRWAAGEKGETLPGRASSPVCDAVSSRPFPATIPPLLNVASSSLRQLLA